jgi:hypothetical protein
VKLRDTVVAKNGDCASWFVVPVGAVSAGGRLQTIVIGSPTDCGMNCFLDGCLASVKVNFSETAQIDCHLVEVITCLVKTTGWGFDMEAVGVLVMEAKDMIRFCVFES